MKITKDLVFLSWYQFVFQNLALSYLVNLRIIDITAILNKTILVKSSTISK